MKILSSLYLVRTQYNLFDAVEFQQRYRKNPFALGDAYLTPFLSMCAVAFHTKHGQNNTFKCDTEGFLSVASFDGLVGLPLLFIRYLIGRTEKKGFVVYIIAK